MKFIFIDSDPLVAESLARKFQPFSEISVFQGDLLKVARQCIVSPANSQGFMDGGIDKEYLGYFGPTIQQKVMAAIALRPKGTLPIGASSIISTGNATIPYLILAPTMESPEFIPSENIYRAMRAILRSAKAAEGRFDTIYCPGLGTGVGGVPAATAAEQMVEAYRDAICK